jgi:hypothetical protein
VGGVRRRLNRVERDYGGGPEDHRVIFDRALTLLPKEDVLTLGGWAEKAIEACRRGEPMPPFETQEQRDANGRLQRLMTEVEAGRYWQIADRLRFPVDFGDEPDDAASRDGTAS